MANLPLVWQWCCVTSLMTTPAAEWTTMCADLNINAIPQAEWALC